ncbi:MAG: hypothetical protein COA78_35935, partial [Blastopirellula sp.]
MSKEQNAVKVALLQQLASWQAAGVSVAPPGNAAIIEQLKQADFGASQAENTAPSTAPADNTIESPVVP